MTIKKYTITFKIDNFPEIETEVKAESEDEAKQKAYNVIIQEHPELKDKPVNKTTSFSSNQQDE